MGQKISLQLTQCDSRNLREVPSSGLEKWIPLEKPETKTKGMIWKPPIGGGGNGGTAGGAGGRGEVFIRLLLSTEKDQTLTAQVSKTKKCTG